MWSNDNFQTTYRSTHCRIFFYSRADSVLLQLIRLQQGVVGLSFLQRKHFSPISEPWIEWDNVYRWWKQINLSHVTNMELVPGEISNQYKGNKTNWRLGRFTHFFLALACGCLICVLYVLQNSSYLLLGSRFLIVSFMSHRIVLTIYHK